MYDLCIVVLVKPCATPVNNIMVKVVNTSISEMYSSSMNHIETWARL